MKRTSFKLTIAAGILLLLSSCSNFLDQPVQGENVNTPVYYDNVDNANMAVVACYDGLQIEDDKYSCFQWMYGDVMSDDAWKGGDAASDGADIATLKDWSALPTNIYLNATWKSYFVAIFRANTVIQNMAGVTFSDKLKKQYIAEAKFIRAYSYLTLVKLYGDVPLFTEPVTPDQLSSVVRTPFADVLTQIEKDFEEAAVDLPASYPSDQLGRATSGAAKGLEARTIMYAIGMFKSQPTSDWQKVYDLTDGIIQSGYYGLLSNYAEIFEIEGENSSESLFEIQHATTRSGWGDQNEGSNSPIYVGNRGTISNPDFGWGFDLPTPSLVQEYENQDPRMNATVMGNGVTQYVYGVKRDVPTASYLTGYVTRKLQTDPSMYGDNQSDYPGNVRIIRYADVILMKAEAAYHLGNEAVARQCLNMVRARARQSTYPKGYNLGSNTYPETGFINNLPDVTATGTALMDAIKHERRVEFGQESLRYWDLVRWGDYRTTLAADVQARFDRRQLRGVPVIPIPNDEVVAWGLVQNPN